MSFIWPVMLLSLLLVPLLVAAYAWLVSRRRDGIAALGALRLTESKSGRRMGRRRHISSAIFLLAITLLLAAMARPTMVVAVPRQEGTAVLAFDVSNSMMADDFKPSRIGAAKEAAGAFAKAQPSTIQVGVVAFSSGAVVVQQPTDPQADVLAAIDRLSTEGGTSLGEGMLTALRAIAGKPIELDQAALEGDLENVDIGYYGSAVIVLLSDGEDTSRSDPVVMARLAANAGVRVFTIGVGSPEGTTVEIEGFRVATSLNEELLQEIADVTGGTYFHAADEAELKQIYDSIDLQLTIEGEEREVTALAAAAAVVLLLVGAGFAMLWFGRVP